MTRWRRPGVVAVLLVTAFVFAVGWLPPLARPGYELGLVTGLFAPAVLALASAAEQRREWRSPGDALRSGSRLGVLAAVGACGAACFHGVRAGFCDPAQGLLLYVLGPMFGMVLASVWGGVSIEVVRAFGGEAACRRSAWLVVAALAAPLGTLACNLFAFHATPVVFAFDPFVGYFSGSLYDTVIESSGLAVYRTASVASLVALAVFAAHLERREGRLVLLWRRWPGIVAVGASALTWSLGSVVAGPSLGHWQTAGTIAARLGATTDGAHCRIVHDPAVRDEARVLATDCDAHVRELVDWFGLGEPSPVVAYLFRDAEQKRALMGAAQTSIAKPWRGEIYLQSDDFPHPVLRHELAHALAARIARGPFRVAGSWGGWLPNPGLIEGVAEAAAPRDDELSADEWAAAMRRLELLPRLERLFGVSFFAGVASASYTAAGSFVGFVRRNHGSSTIARWYAGEDLVAVTGVASDALEQAWWRDLDAIPLSEAALVEARQRFDQPGVLGRRCPHSVDRLLGEASARESTDPEGASRRYERALALDARSVRAVFGIAACQARSGRTDEAMARLEDAASAPGWPAAVRGVATERLGDLALRRGATEEAQQRYRSVLASTVSEDRLRTLELKMGATGDEVARAALLPLLIGTDASGPNAVEALDRLGEWSAAAPTDGVPSYLIGRQLVIARRWAAAQRRLDEALERSLPARIEAEALRLRVRAGCALGSVAVLDRLERRFLGLDVVSSNRKARFSEFVRRCR